MDITIEIDEYDADDGLTMSFVEGGKVRIVSQDENGCAITGDKDGLVTLATAMLTVAYNIGKAHPSEHIHVDTNPMLSSGSSWFVIQQLKESD